MGSVSLVCDGGDVAGVDGKEAVLDSVLDLLEGDGGGERGQGLEDVLDAVGCRCRRLGGVVT